MATNKGNTNNTSGSGLNTNAIKPYAKSWADRTEEFLSNLQKKMLSLTMKDHVFLLSREMKVTFQKHLLS